MNQGMYTSDTGEWETPHDLFKYLDRLYNFTLDPCASKSNAKCKKFFTKEDNGLIETWIHERVFMNPPYGKEIKDWVRKAYLESKNAKVVALIPARTDTDWFQQWVFPRAYSIFFIDGRLQFLEEGWPVGSAPFPSCVVEYRMMADDQKPIGNSIKIRFGHWKEYNA